MGGTTDNSQTVVGNLVELLQVVGHYHIGFGNEAFDGGDEVALPESGRVDQLERRVQEGSGDDEIDGFALVDNLLGMAADFDARRVDSHFTKIAVVVSVLGKAFAYFGFTDIPAYPCRGLL